MPENPLNAMIQVTFIHFFPVVNTDPKARILTNK